MLIGASQFCAAGFASPANVGADPRRFLAASFVAGGTFASKLSLEFKLEAVVNMGGELDAPFIRRKRTDVQMRGLFAVGGNILVSPVMVTLDGSGGLTIGINYVPGWMRSVLEAGGGLSVHANAHLRSQIAAQADGDIFARLSEYQKIKVRLEGGGELSPLFSRAQYLTGRFQAGGGVRIAPWYELIGEVDEVVRKRICVVVASVPRKKVACVSAVEPEDITVLEVGI
ncbi:MAG: hypothetical protein V3573_14420 [Desulfovibrionaceae bacterium]